MNLPAFLKMDIIKELFLLQDLQYRDFHSRLMPNIEKERIIGVRTPDLRTLAKRLAKSDQATAFLEKLPHHYYEENNLHGALITYGKYTYDETLALLESFLPHIDNWATCDMFVPSILKKDIPKTEKMVRQWLSSDHPYLIRFGINCLMHFFMEDHFKTEHFKWVDEVKSEDYYVKMAVAWYYSVALVKRWPASIKHLSENPLEKWVQNKAIQKGRESNRLTKEQKEFLLSLKIK